MAEPSEPIITHVPSSEELASRYEHTQPMETEVIAAAHEAVVATPEKSAQNALGKMNEFILNPRSVDGTMGGVEREAQRLVNELGPRIGSLAPEEQIIALHSVDRLQKCHIALAGKEDITGYIRGELKNRVYGTNAVEKVVTEQKLSKDGQPSMAIEWSGAPVELSIEGQIVTVIKDEKLGWVYSDKEGNYRAVGEAATIGRGDFPGQKNTESTISREHVKLLQTAKGELVVLDTSLNGTGIKLERYPTQVEFTAQEAEKHVAVADNRKSGARDRIKKLWRR